MGTFFTGETSPGLIDWTSMPTYNTIMAVAAGATLFALVLFVRGLAKRSALSRTEAFAEGTEERRELAAFLDGYAVAFGVFGLIVFTTGLHMILTWPLAEGGFPFDNIVFGETCVPLGALALGLSIYLWRRRDSVLEAPNPLVHLARVASPVGFFTILLGLALIGIALAGLVYQLFAAPPQEPISGAFSNMPMLENGALAILFCLVAFGAICFPFITKQIRDTGTLTPLATAAGWCLAIAGIAWGLFGAMNFYTHIGLIVNTM